MPAAAKNYRYRPLQYATCSVCGCECRRRGPVPWVHFGTGSSGVSYFEALHRGTTTEHEPVVTDK